MVPYLRGLPLSQSDDFKIFPHPVCSSKSHKYNNYDKATYMVSPYCYFPQENLLTRLFTAPQLTLDYFRRAASLTRYYSLHLILIWPQGHQEPSNKGGSQDTAKHLVGFGWNQDSSDSECSALTHFSKSLAHK